LLRKIFTKTNVYFHQDERSGAGIILFTIFAVAAGFGVYSRFKGLGLWPLATDEYYIAKSIASIHQSGLPHYECGGYYVRGLLFQYIAAFLALFGGNTEFWLRIPSAFFNLAVIPPLYWLMRKICGVVGAVAASTVFLMSVWEVEFARFGRMYSLFQAIFGWYLYFLYRVYNEDDDKSKTGMYFLSSIAVFVHEGSVFLSIFNFFPLLRRGRFYWKDLAVSAAIVILNLVFYAIDFESIGVKHIQMPETAADGMVSLPLKIPLILLLNVRTDFISLLFAFLTVTSSLAAIYLLARNRVINITQKCFLAIIVISGLLNQIGLALIGFIVYGLSQMDENSDDQASPIGLTGLSVLINFVCWTAFKFTSAYWEELVKNYDSFPFSKNLTAIFFKFPDIIGQVVLPFWEAVPVLTIISGLLIYSGLLMCLRRRAPELKGLDFALLCVVICVTLVGAVSTHYRETRYVFFAYPLIIMAGVAVCVEFVRRRKHLTTKVVITIGMVILYGLSEDFDLKHLANIEKPEVNFRMNLSRETADHFYQRMDFRTPADAIDAAASDSDTIISSVTPVEFYLNRLNYMYIPRDDVRFKMRAACGGNKDKWSLAELIGDESTLDRIIRQAQGSVWLIGYSDTSKLYFKFSKDMNKKYLKFLYFTGIDRAVNVYKIPGGTVQ
jgi:hypothetical protein